MIVGKIGRISLAAAAASVFLVALQASPVSAHGTNCKPPPANMKFWAQYDTSVMDPDIIGNLIPTGTNTSPHRTILTTDIPGHAGGYLHLGAPKAHVNYAGGANSVFGFHTGDFSLDVWVRIPKSGKMNDIPILDTHTGTPWQRGVMLSTTFKTVAFMMTDQAGDSWSWVTNIMIHDGVWHHLAVSVDRDNAQKSGIYVDGKRKKVSFWGGPGPNTALIPFDPTLQANKSLGTANPLRVGLGGDDGFGKTPHSSPLDIDEIEIFDRALTPLEIAALHARPKCH